MRESSDKHRIRRLEVLFCFQSIFLIIAFSAFQNWKQSLQVPVICSQCSRDVTDITYTKTMPEFSTNKPIEFYNTTSQSIPPVAHHSEREEKPDEYSPKTVTNPPESVIIKSQVPQQTNWMNKVHRKLSKNLSRLSYSSNYVTSSENNELVSRKLQSSRPMHSPLADVDSSLFLQRDQICDKLPLLSPINDMSNFTFDERVHRILLIIQSMTSIDLLNNFNSPQYKAACWILYDDELQMLPDDKLIIERYVLTVFIFATSQNSTGLLHLPNNTCDIPFVACENMEMWISSIDLTRNQLVGTIPSELSHLSHLVSMNFQANGLFGSIPSELGRLLNLEVLDVFNNGLTGTLPSEIGNLRSLEYVDTSFNNLGGAIPSEVGQLNNLTHIGLNNNDMEGSIPVELYGCERLVTLSLGSNNFTGPISREIRMLQNLENLYLYNNSISGLIPREIGSISSLKNVFLYNNALTGSLPREIKNLVSLEQLWINSNEINGTLPDVFESLGALQVLEISRNGFSGLIPTSLWNQKFRNSTLILSENNLEGSIPDDFCSEESLFADASEWFLDEPRIKCACCSSLHCYMWRQNDDAEEQFTLPPPPLPKNNDGNQPKSTKSSKAAKARRRTQQRKARKHHRQRKLQRAQGGADGSDGKKKLGNDDPTDLSASDHYPHCPGANIQEVEFQSNLRIVDIVTDTIFTESFSDSFGKSRICLSPSGCYSLSYVASRQVLETNFLGYSAKTKSLIFNDVCDAVSVCGVPFHANNSKRIGLNHITQMAFSDMDILNDLNDPQSKALCWIMTQDSLFDNFDVCDGTLLQRFILANFYYDQGISVDFEDLAVKPTCQWPGITCDGGNKFVTEINMRKKGLRGNLFKGLGLLIRIKKIDLSQNHLHGSLSDSLFFHMPYLEVLDVSNNMFGGSIPQAIFELKSIKKIDLSNNQFDNDMVNVDCSNSLESIDISFNLVTGGLSDKINSCTNLKKLNLAHNNFKEPIPSEFGAFHKLETILLQENSLSGDIPKEIFNSTVIEVFMVHSNKLTGSIPTEIGLLSGATTITMDHNSLKGNIPNEIENLRFLKRLQLHNNQLHGQAPRLENADVYITDCGDPFYNLRFELECESCTMCCNSDGACQVNIHWPIPVGSLAFLVAVLAPFGILIISSVILKLKTMAILTEVLGDHTDEAEPFSVFKDDSVYCLILSKNLKAWFIYACTLLLQTGIFVMFLIASSFNFEETDWRYTFRCLSNEETCEDTSSTTLTGWVFFGIVVVAFLAVDFVLGYHQITLSIQRSCPQLFFSGMGMLYITTLALFTSVAYNYALASSNTDLIVNAVILLFVNDMDECFLEALMYIAPKWTVARFSEILETIPHHIEQRRDSINTAVVETVMIQGRRHSMVGGVIRRESILATNIETSSDRTLNIRHPKVIL